VGRSAVAHTWVFLLLVNGLFSVSEALWSKFGGLVDVVDAHLAQPADDRGQTGNGTAQVEGQGPLGGVGQGQYRHAQGQYQDEESSEERRVGTERREWE